MRIAILGPLDVTDDAGRPLAVAGARLRSLLIRLALDPARTVGVDALTDAVWDGDPPAGAANALQTLVSRLRRSLPSGAIAAEPAGYRISATVDIGEFGARLRDARAAAADGDMCAAADHYDAALALWRGQPLSDVTTANFARATIARLVEAGAAATEERLAVRLALGDGGPIVAELEELAAAHPLRERPHRLLITALADAGRASDAVGVYSRLRDRLADQLGLDPSPELTAAYTAMLRGEQMAAMPGCPAPADRPGARPPDSQAAGARAAEPGGASKGNLRPALTSFVGRDAESARLAAMVREHRLVTLVGPGGAGKTRLAIEVGHALRGDFSGGAWIVELAPVGNPEDVPRALAQALQLREMRALDERGADRLRVLDQLEGADLLLILDNCEHVIDACARAVEEVLAHCPGVRIVATSREPLAITSEVLSPLGPLATPPVTAGADRIAGAAAVRLFTDRAAAVRPGFSIDEGTDTATALAVAEICRRLDGMPLAIELACARLRTMPVEQIAARLDDRFRLLTGGSRTALPRHRTLAAVVEWSWDLLDTAEQDLAMRFAVFAGGATMDGVVEVCGADSVEPLAGLVDKSFVVLADDGRYRMLETIRAYAAERLAEAGAADIARRAHADYFTRLAIDADAHLRGHGQPRSLRLFRGERDNLGGALRWSIDSGDGRTAVCLAAALGWYWMMSDYHAEAVSRIGEALALPDAAPPSARAKALALYGMNAAVIGTPSDGEAAVAEAQRLAPDDPTVILCRVFVAILPVGRDAARTYLPLALEHPDPWVRAMGLTVRGIMRMYAASPDDAERDLTAGLTAFEAIGDGWARAMLGGALGELRAVRGDTDGAVAVLRRSATIAESLGVEDVAAGSILQIALVRARRGDLDGAQAEVEHARMKLAQIVSPVLDLGIEVAEAEIARRRGDLRLARDRYRRTLDEIVDVHGVPRETYGALLAGLLVTEVLLGDHEAVRGTSAALLAHTVREHIVVVWATMAFAAAVRDVDAAQAAYLVGVADAMRGIAEQGNPDVEWIVSAARQRLGDETYEWEHARGRAIDGIDAAIDALHAAVATLDSATSPDEAVSPDTAAQAIRR